MLQRLLLELPHRVVRPIDRRPYLRPVAMLRLDRVRQPRIVGAQLEFQRLLADREASLFRSDLRMLGVGNFERPVEKRMKLGFNRRLPRDISASDENPCDRRGKGDQCDQQQAAPVVHSPPPSKDEGASAGGAPKGATDSALTGVPGSAEPAIPIASAEIRSEEHTSALQSLMRNSY